MPAFRKRTYAGFKRKRAGYAPRAFKRRRITRRRTTSYGTKTGRASSLFFSKRRISGRTFRRTIFRGTQFTPHYRSIGTSSGSVSTQVGSSTATQSYVDALDNGVATFWNSTGGVLTPDAGVAIPLFRNDIIIRGGKIGFRVYNDGAYPMHMRVWLVKTKDNWTTANYSATVPIGWDPTCVVDWHKDFSFIRNWDFIIESLNMTTIEHKLRPMKIDQVRWSTNISRLMWMFSVSDGDTSGQDNARIVSYFNISFSGDAIGTT